MLVTLEWQAVGEDPSGGSCSQREKNEIHQAPTMCQDLCTKAFYSHATCVPEGQQPHPKCHGSLCQDSLVYDLNFCVEGSKANPRGWSWVWELNPRSESPNTPVPKQPAFQGIYESGGANAKGVHIRLPA